MTTSLVLKPDQARLLKLVAATRMMRGQMQTASVSEVIRQLITDNENALLPSFLKTAAGESPAL